MKIKQERLREIIKEEIAAIHSAKEEALTEMASFGRVKAKIEDKHIPFVMISAFRGGLSREENLSRQKELEASVASAGFPWTKMPGSGYVEEPEEEGGEPREVKENSILIWDEERPDKPRIGVSLFETAQQLAHTYSQDSFIFGAPEELAGETSMAVRVYDKSGGLIKEPWAGPWYNIQQAADDDFYWSVIGSKRTKLTELEDKYSSMRAGSFMGAVKKDYYHKAAKSGLRWIDNRRQK
jgi:hypothetical protein